MDRSSGMEMMNYNDDDWSELPFDLLALITDKVITFSLADYVRFGCICVQWRSFLIKNNNYEQIKLSSSNLPVLLISSLDYHHHSDYQEEKNPIDFYNYYNPNVIWQGLNHEQRHMNTRSFYSLFEAKVYDFQLPVPSYMNCRGSSHGWLVLVEECRDGTYPVHLFNPFRSSDKNKIHLPPLSTFSTLDPIQPIRNRIDHSFFLKKAMFSKSPSMSSFLNNSNPTTTTSSTTYDDDDDEELVVFGLTDICDIEFCRPGDRAWTLLPVPLYPTDDPEYVSAVFDIIFYKGQLWGILQNGVALTFEIHPEPKFTIVVYPHPDDSYAQQRYLVESAGDLFQVRRYLYEPDDGGSHLTTGFQVFKLDQGIMQWVKTNTLDGCMLFLGDNASISVSIADYFPLWCKPNSIFFTDDYYQGYCSHPCLGPHDAGIFNLEDRSFRRFYTMTHKAIMPPPIWIQPMP